MRACLRGGRVEGLPYPLADRFHRYRRRRSVTQQGATAARSGASCRLRGDWSVVEGSHDAYRAGLYQARACAAAANTL